MNIANEMTKQDFDVMVSDNNMEVFDAFQFGKMVDDMGSVLEKSETYGTLEVDDQQTIDVLTEEIKSLERVTVLDWNPTTASIVKSLNYVRMPQITWAQDEEGNIMKGELGIFLDTPLNQKLERVGTYIGKVPEGKELVKGKRESLLLKTKEEE